MRPAAQSLNTVSPTERQDAEITIYNRVKADIENARKTMSEAAFKGNGEWVNPNHFLFGGIGILRGLVGPRSLSAFTRSQIAFGMSFVGAGIK